jgi:hypothetical protein
VQRGAVERLALRRSPPRGCRARLARRFSCAPRLGALLAVQHVGAGDVVLARAHQRELDLVLDVFYMEGAALRLAAQQRAAHRLGQVADHLADARRGGALAPFTARNALVIATEILPARSRRPAPLRRITLKSAYGLRAGCWTSGRRRPAEPCAAFPERSA